MSTSRRPPYRPAWGSADRRAEPADLQASDKGDLHLGQALAADRAATVFRDTEACAACAAVRKAQADSEALCDDHLGRALGVTGGWALGAPGRKLRQ